MRFFCIWVRVDLGYELNLTLGTSWLYTVVPHLLFLTWEKTQNQLTTKQFNKLPWRIFPIVILTVILSLLIHSRYNSIKLIQQRHISIVLYHRWHDSIWSPLRHAGDVKRVVIGQLWEVEMYNDFLLVAVVHTLYNNTLQCMCVSFRLMQCNK